MFGQARVVARQSIRITIPTKESRGHQDFRWFTTAGTLMSGTFRIATRSICKRIAIRNLPSGSLNESVRFPRDYGLAWKNSEEHRRLWFSIIERPRFFS